MPRVSIFLQPLCISLSYFRHAHAASEASSATGTTDISPCSSSPFPARPAQQYLRASAYDMQLQLSVIRTYRTFLELQQRGAEKATVLCEKWRKSTMSRLGDTVDPLYNTGSIYTAVHSINTRADGVQAANPIRSSAAHGLLPSVAVQNARDTEALLSFMLQHCAEIAVAAESLCCNAAQLYGFSCSIDAFDKEHLLRRRRWGPADIHLYTDCLFDYVERCYSRLAEALSSVCLGFMGAPSVVEKIFAIPGGINSLVLRPLKTMLEFYERLYAAARCYELRLSAKTNDGMGEYVLNVDASINAERPADFWSSIDEWCRVVRQALQENMAVIEELLLALEEAELLCNNAER